MADPPQVAPEEVLGDKELAASRSVEAVGPIEDLEEVETPDQAPGPRFSNEEHRAKATKLLALLLFAALISSLPRPR